MDFDVYRMRINPNGAKKDAKPLEFCREEQIVGLGHDIYTDRTYDSFDEVKGAHWEYEREHYDNWTRFNNDGETLNHELRYILDEINVGDYVWLNRKNDFYVCKIRPVFPCWSTVSINELLYANDFPCDEFNR